MVNMDIYILRSGKLKQTSNLSINQYSSDTVFRVFSEVYVDEMFVTYSNSNARSHLVYDRFDGEYYLYKLLLNEDNCTGVACTSAMNRFTLTVRGYKKDDNGYLQSYTTCAVPITLIRTDSEKELSRDYNGTDVKNLWIKSGQLTNDISNEVNRATTAETLETNRAIEAEEAERDRAQLAERAETSRAENAESELFDGISNIASGSTIVGKSDKDALGNKIDTFYEKKSDGTTNRTNILDLQTRTSTLESDMTAAKGNITAINEILPNKSTTSNLSLHKEISADLGYNLISIYYDGVKVPGSEIQVPVDSVVVDGYYDNVTNEIVLVLENGNEIRINAAGLIDVYTGSTGDQINININNNVVTAFLKDSSIPKTKLTPEFLTEYNNFAAQEEQRQANELVRIANETEREDWFDNAQSTLDGKADADGYYANLGSGYADQLVSPDGTEDIDSWRYRQTGGTKDVSDGSVSISSIKGESRRFNQLIDLTNEPSTTNNGITYTVDSVNGKITVNGTSNARSNYNYLNEITVIPGHKYCVSCPIGTVAGKVSGYLILRDGIEGTVKSEIYLYSPMILTPSWTSFQYRIYVWVENTTVNNLVFKPQLFDLTQIYGEGNEPTTPEEFYNDWGSDYKPYTTGSIVSVKPTEIKTIGFNQLNDSDFENGVYTDPTGEVAEATNSVRVRVKVLPNTKYELCSDKLGSDIILNSYVWFYDTDCNLISNLNINDYLTSSSFIFDMPSNCAYFGFAIKGKSITDLSTLNISFYNVCLHLVHTGYKNGQYEKYWTKTLPIKLNTFPDGLQGVNGVYDEKDYLHRKNIQRFGIVDLGTLTWNYNNTNSFFYAYVLDKYKGINNLINQKYPYGSIWDSNANKVCCGNGSNGTIYIKDTSYTDTATFKSAMNGVYLVYELATPIISDMSVNENNVYNASDFGTEEYIGNIYKFNPITVNYIDNLRDKLRNLPSGEDLREELDNKADKVGLAQGLISGSSLNLVSDKGLTNTTPFTKRTLANVSGVKSGVARYNKIKGQSLVMNQLLNPSNYIAATSKNNVSYTPNTDGTITITVGDGGASGDASFLIDDIYFENSRKYLLRGCASNAGSGKGVILINALGRDSGNSFIFNGNNTTQHIYVYMASGCPAGTYIFRPNLIDLTQMFGTGNEPTTATEFNVQFPNYYYAYTEGQIIDSKVTKIRANGLNQFTGTNWIKGYISSTDSIIVSNDEYKVCLDYVEVIGNTQYKLDMDVVNGGYYIVYYDENKEVVSRYEAYSKPLTFTTPANCKFIRVWMYNPTQAYIPSKCLLWIPGSDLSGLTIDGYAPYEEYYLDVNVSQFTNGMRSAGSACDYKDYAKKKNHKVIESVDLGTLSWAKSTNYSNTCYFVTTSINGLVKPATLNLLTIDYTATTYNNLISDNGNMTICIAGNLLCVKDNSYTDVATFTAAMNGVILNYESSIDIVTDFEPNETSGLIVNAHGLEWIEQAEGFISPLGHETIYQEDLKKNIEDTIGKFNALATALNATFTVDGSGNWTCTLH